MGTEKIGKIEGIFLILSFIINLIILSLPRILIASCGSSSLMNTVYISILSVAVVLLISKLLGAFPGQNILDISNFLGGKTFQKIVGTLFIIFFIFTAFTVLKSFSESLNTIYYNVTPPFFVTGIFCIIIAYSCSLGFKAVSRANIIITPLAIISIFLLLLLNTEHLVYQRMYPILGFGISSTFFEGASNLFAFGNIAIIYFIPSFLTDPKELKKVSLTAIVWSSICLFISIATVLFIFSYIAPANGIMPLYLASREIEFGRFFQRVDALFILLWTISIVCFLTILVLFATKIFKSLTGVKNKTLIGTIFSGLLFLLCLIPKNIYNIFFLESTIYKYTVILFVFIFNILILLFANLKRLRKEESNEKEI